MFVWMIDLVYAARSITTNGKLISNCSWKGVEHLNKNTYFRFDNQTVSNRKYAYFSFKLQLYLNVCLLLNKSSVLTYKYYIVIISRQPIYIVHINATTSTIFSPHVFCTFYFSTRLSDAPLCGSIDTLKIY